MRRKFQPFNESNTEFDLDLAPLLSVMVKLVPVLLLSSAFVQMNMIETELPQVVQEALKEQSQENKNKPLITVAIQNNLNVDIWIQHSEKTDHVVVPASGKDLDTKGLHKQFVSIKQKYPDVFKIDLKPDENVPYDHIVQIMDEARKSRDPQVRFPVMDKIKNEMTNTDYMFPEVIFVNTTEG